MGSISSVSSAVAPSRVRFGVLGFACILAFITYLDRISMMRVRGDISENLGFSDFQMGWVFNAFTLGYLLFEVPVGWMGDAWGSRRVLTRIVLCWSVFTALTGAVWAFSLQVGGVVVFDAFAAMLLMRFLFGCGEAGAFPILARVVGNWFPYQERGLAQGVIWNAARLGGAFSPVVIGRLAVWIGWRQAFWVLGAIGLVWCFFFHRWYRNTPEEKPEVNEAERELIRAGPYSFKSEQAAAAHAFPPWRRLLTSTNLMAVCLASAGVSFSWYFYATWQIKFLQDQYGLKDAYVEIVSGLPFVFGAAGSLIGGRLSDWLVPVLGRRWGRSLLGFVSFSLTGLCILAAGFSPNIWLTMSLLCLGSFINDLAIPAIWAASTDIGGQYSGTVAGTMNMVGGLGPLISQPLMPWMIAHGFSWPETLAVLTSGWFIGALAWLRIDATEPLIPEEEKPLADITSR